LSEKDYKKTSIGKIARKPFFVFSNEKISDLLIELKKNINHMAIVINDKENLTGLITIEDLIEEIVGDIVGESDR
jgi:putative hemolysin